VLVSHTPTTEISKLVISTRPPTPPTSLLPLHPRARALLRSTCNNSNTEIASRAAERTSILGFLTTFLEGPSMDDGQNAAGLFISGLPGIGKTALVNTIIRELSTMTGSNVKVVFINCMVLKRLMHCGKG
jgi:cell division control protein 6